MSDRPESYSSFDKTDLIRQELDGKIGSKVAESTFWTVIGIIVVVLLGATSWAVSSAISMGTKLTRLETLMETKKNR